MKTASMQAALAGAFALVVVTAAGCAHTGGGRATAEGELPPAAGQPLAPRKPVRAASAADLTTPDLDTEMRDDAPLRYVVKRGDTLWDIAGYYLRDPWYWPQLWDANPDIANPHLIYPGEVLVLTRGGDGQPRLERSRTERLSPRIREMPLDAAIATIPLAAIRAFINGPRLVTDDELQNAPYVVAFVDKHLIAGAGNTVYVRGADPRGPETYAAVRITGPYTDPASGETLGKRAVPVGEIKIDEFDDVSTGEITHSYREALTGDRLLPIEDQELTHDYYPHAPATAIESRLISVQDGVYSVGQYQIVTLNKGSRDGLERGHVLNVFEPGGLVNDPVEGGQVRLPEKKAGQLLVFKTDERVSFALIMRATRALHIGDIARSPQQ